MTFLVVAYSVLWAGLFLYTFRLGTQQKRLLQEIASLERVAAKEGHGG